MSRLTTIATIRGEKQSALRIAYIAAVAAVAVILAALFLVANRLPHSLIQIDSLAPADVIIAENWANPNIAVLEQAGELQRQGYGRYVVVPYQIPMDERQAESGKTALRVELACEAARLNPYTTEKIPLGQAGLHSLGDARVVSAILHRDRVKRVILVTTLFHSRKSALAYSKFLGRDVKVISAPVRGQLTPENWWRTSAGRRVVVSNFLKLQYYRAVVL